jgi:hypothetical protein
LDELLNFQNARYISASEACWRTLDFNLHKQKPQTERLPVHLENLQPCTYNGNQPLPEIVQNNKYTQLTEFFNLNVIDPEARKLKYWEVPQYYVWKDKKWAKRL